MRLLKSNKTVLLTGCSSGIGYFCAHALHKDGYKVFATCRDAKDVKRLQDEGLHAYRLDLCDSNSIAEALAWVVLQTDAKIDILFNNAAFGQPGAVEDLKRSVLIEQFETNVFGTQELTNVVLPFMRKNGYGRVIYNSSVLGFAAMKYRGAYNASKFAIEGLADTMRLELKGSGIDVVLIEPGPIRSEFRKNALAKFQEHIDIAVSAHKEVYEKTLERLRGSGDAPFTLAPEAVYAVLLKAIEAKKPRIRYAVTFPTKLFGALKRILPDRAMDFILGSVD
ncbi:MAG: SDR family NAD(P)-dependent oxidoreductase [Sulfurospirillum sp.]|nr:SDR family NAD(P)-dependent oxidoreductase [Sulfurospirillum sp.]